MRPRKRVMTKEVNCEAAPKLGTIPTRPRRIAGQCDCSGDKYLCTLGLTTPLKSVHSIWAKVYPSPVEQPVPKLCPRGNAGSRP